MVNESVDEVEVVVVVGDCINGFSEDVMNSFFNSYIIGVYVYFEGLVV